MSKTTDYKEGKAAVEIIYYRSKTLKGGLHPFMVRSTKDGKRAYAATRLNALWVLARNLDVLTDLLCAYSRIWPKCRTFVARTKTFAINCLTFLLSAS